MRRLIQIIAPLLALSCTVVNAGPWYSSASFVAAYGEIDGLDPRGAQPGPLNATGRADEVVGLGLALGHDWQGSPWRSELEYVWRYRTDLNFNQLLPAGRVNGFKNDIATQQVLANIYLDLPQGHRFHPYIGAGAGVVHHGINTYRSLDLTFPGGSRHSATTEFSWAAMIGVVMDRFHHGRLQVGYRFTHLGKIRTDRFPDRARFRANAYRSHDIVVAWQLAL